MFLVPKNLKIFVVSSIYDSVESSRDREFFGKMIALKIRGYRKEYPYGVMPVDSYDFISTHYITCEQKDGEWEPIMALKSVTLEKAELHRLPFPGLAVVRSSNASVHEHEMKKVVDRCRAENTKLSYSGSWTVDPMIRENRAYVSWLRDLNAAILISRDIDEGVNERVACGAPTLKTDAYLEKLGYTRMSHFGYPLPAFQQNSLIGAPAVTMHCNRWSDYGMELVEKFQSLWKEREILGQVPAAIAEDSGKKAA